MPIVKNREYRNLATLQANENEKRIDSDFYVEGMATTFNKPYELYEFDGVKYYEEIDRNAFSGADMSDIIMQYDHAGKVLARKSNDTLIVEVRQDGLFMAADLSKSNASKEMYEEIQSGLVTRMSWAFIVSEEKYDKETRTRTILKVKKVFDVSAVSIPANNDTEIMARSFVEGVSAKEKQELRELRKRKLLLKLKLEE